MRKLLFSIVACSLLVAGCNEADGSTVQDAKQNQAEKGAALAQTVLSHSSENAEQENIANRLKLTMNPGQIGFILLMNQAGQPIAYYGVKGKITSGGKRLTNPQKWATGVDCGGNYCDEMVTAPSDEGTYGESDPYVYFWTADGQYIQWNGAYLYSDKPFRTRVEPLVIAIGDKS